MQHVRAEATLRACLKSDDFYPHGMECSTVAGLSLLLSRHCGHLWSSVPQRPSEPHVTALDKNCAVPWKRPQLDLLFSYQAFQNILDANEFSARASALVRYTKPGARVILVEAALASSKAPRPRTVQVLSSALHLRQGWAARRVSLGERPGDYWLIDGIRS